MKSEKKIFFAFILNLVFSLAEFVGGILTGSVAIISDAVHDIGDAASIGIAFSLEKKSKKQPDETYTYGYARFSVVGSMITTLILMVGSVLVVFNAVRRIFNPVEIHYDGMLVFAVVGVIINLAAAIFTRHGGSLNQRSVSLHMLEDVLGWIVVLIGAVVMKLTDIRIIDPLMSIAVAAFIFYHALRNLNVAVGVFMEKAPKGVDMKKVKADLLKIKGVQDVHHIHIWSLDGANNYATLHAVIDGDAPSIKDALRRKLEEHKVGHVTLELEAPGEYCAETDCHVEAPEADHHHHHHNH